MQKIIDNVHKYHISKGTDGRWTTYVPDETKPDGRRKVKKKSRSDLHKYLLTFYHLSESGKLLTFSELYARWVEYKRQFVGASNRKRSLSPSTIRRYERDYDNYIKGTKLDNSILAEITTSMLETEIANMIKSHNMSERCAGNVIGNICQSLSYARRSEYIVRDPAELIDRALLLSCCRFDPPKDDAERVLSITEFQALYNSVIVQQEAHPEYMPNYAIELAMLTGMRGGELAALHWSSIDDDFIRIDFSEHRLDFSDRPSVLEIGEPKNGKHRMIQITEEIRNVFNKVKSLGFTSEVDFVFIREDGSRYTGHDISCACDRRGNEAGIKKTSIHCIRRTVSSMLNTVLPQKAVAEMLGHTERVNEEHYNYSMAENAEKMRALEEVHSKIIRVFPKVPNFGGCNSKTKKTGSA